MLREINRYDIVAGFHGSLATGNFEFIDYCWKFWRDEPLRDYLTKLFMDCPHFMFSTVVGGNDDIIKEILPICNSRSGILGAFVSNRPTWIRYFMNHGASVDMDCIVSAIKHGHLDLVQEYFCLNWLQHFDALQGDRTSA